MQVTVAAKSTPFAHKGARASAIPHTHTKPYAGYDADQFKWRGSSAISRGRRGRWVVVIPPSLSPSLPCFLLFSPHFLAHISLSPSDSASLFCFYSQYLSQIKHGGKMLHDIFLSNLYIWMSNRKHLICCQSCSIISLDLVLDLHWWICSVCACEAMLPPSLHLGNWQTDCNCVLFCCRFLKNWTHRMNHKAVV